MTERALLIPLLLCLLTPGSRAQETEKLTPVPQSPGAQTPQRPTADRLLVGHWVEVKGALSKPGVFLADEIEVLPPGDSESIVGMIEEPPTGDEFKLLGQPVRLSENTRFKDIGRSDLQAVRVRVQGHYRSESHFAAREVAPRGPGRDRIEGRIDRIEDLDGERALYVMSWKVIVKRSSKLEGKAAIEKLPLALPRSGPGAIPRRDEEDIVPRSIRLTEDLSLGGQLEWDAEHRRNLDLNDSLRSDRTDNELSLRIEILWTPWNSLFFLGNFKHKAFWRDDQKSGSFDQNRDEVSQLYGFWNVGEHFDLQFGRAEYNDPRRWLYHTNLDGLRAIVTRGDLRAELSATTKLADASDRDENSQNLMLYLSNASTSRHAALYVVDRDNQDDPGDSPTHVGMRLLGEWLPQNRVWLDAAILRGRSGGQTAEAEAFDIGTTWSPPAAEPFNFTVGYAFATGDKDPLDSTSDTFRQTGLQDDQGKFAGVTSFKYYGELVDPELANIGIFTAGVGARIARRTSLDLVAHQYILDQAVDKLYGSNLRMKPDGIHPELGWEYDLVLGWRALENWQVEVVLGAFDPGAAFPNGDMAYLGALQVRFKF
jgi:alginate production protein